MLMVAAGIGIPIMSALNSGPGTRLNSPVTAAFVLLGQLVSATAFHHFSFFGVERYPLTLSRALGLALMIGGIVLARRPG